MINQFLINKKHLLSEINRKKLVFKITKFGDVGRLQLLHLIVTISTINFNQVLLIQKYYHNCSNYAHYKIKCL